MIAPCSRWTPSFGSAAPRVRRYPFVSLWQPPACALAGLGQSFKEGGSFRIVSINGLASIPAVEHAGKLNARVSSHARLSPSNQPSEQAHFLYSLSCLGDRSKAVHRRGKRGDDLVFSIFVSRKKESFFPGWPGKFPPFAG